MAQPSGTTAKIILAVLLVIYVAASAWHFGHDTSFEKLRSLFQNPGATTISALGLSDWLALGSAFAVLGGLYLIFRSPRPPAAKFFRMHERYLLVFLCMTAVIFILSAKLYDPENKTPMAIMVGAWLATTGWIFTTYTSARNATKAHTMNILVQMRTSAEFNKHRTNIQTRFGYASKLPREAYAKIVSERDTPGAGYENDGTPVGESLRYILNFFEFVSAGVHLEDLDEELIHETMRTIFKNFHSFSEDYITYAVGDDYGKRNERLYRHYRFIVSAMR